MSSKPTIWFCRSLSISVALMIGRQAAVAADRLVPGDFPTIQAAEAAASAGDRIIVSPGTYNTPVGGLVIDVQDLQLLSTGGFGATTIRNNNADEPVIEINAPGVIIGDVDQGFTIEQLTPGPATSFFDGEVCILIHGDQVKFANPVRVQYNRLSGNQNDAAIMINTLIEAGRLIIQENTFVQNAGTFAFTFGIYFYYADHPSTEVGNVALYDAAVDILNNIGSEIDEAAVDIGDRVYKSNLNIDGNDFGFVNAATAEDGVFIYGPIDAFSTTNITNNTMTDAAYGIQVHTDVVNGSTCTITNNTVTNFRNTGVLVDRTLQFSSLTLSGNTLTGDGAADTGIDFATENGGVALVSGNDVSGIDTEGIYCANNSYASTVAITDNTIGSTTQVDYGIRVQTDYFSQTTITGNTINGFDIYGVYEAGANTGAIVTISGNTLDADAGGAQYGLGVDSANNLCHVTLSANTCTDFDTGGIWFGDIFNSSEALVSGNTLTALAAGADYGLEFGAVFNESTFSVEGNTASGFGVAGIVGDDCFNESAMNLAGNTLTSIAAGCDYGIQYGDVFNESAMIMTGNTANGFGVAGALFGDCFNESALDISANVLGALSGGADYGIQQGDTFNESHLSISLNTLEGFDVAGILGVDCFNTSETGIGNNVLNAHSSGALYGIQRGDLFNSSHFSVANNEVNGYGNAAGSAGFHATGGVSDSTLTIAGNSFAPKDDDAEYGVRVTDGFDSAAQGNISSNTISGFTNAGIWLGEVDTGARLSCNYNELSGKASTGAYYGVYNDGLVDYASYFEVIGNGIGNIRGAAGDSAGIYQSGAVDKTSELVFCNNFIRALPGQSGNLMAGVYVYNDLQNGSSLRICDNNIAGFEDASVLLGDDMIGSRLEITGNIMDGGHFGIINEFNTELGVLMIVSRNIITGFDDSGIRLGQVWGAKLEIGQNKIIGAGSDNGIIIADTDANEDGVNSAAEVTIANNCIAQVQDGMEIETILDAAFVNANRNDFDGVLNVGIKNVAGDVAHPINGEDNFFGAVPNKTSGQVVIDPELASPPDADGDGVSDCDDQCFDTAPGTSVDADGCSCLQRNPSADADGDGTLDCDDGCPDDPNKSDPGACGCGVADSDANGNGTPDCNDAAGTPPCGLCGGGVGLMMPLALLSLTWIHRRRRKIGVPRNMP